MKIFPNSQNKDEALLPELPKSLKILPNETNVLFPYMVLPFAVTDQNAKKLVEDAVSSDRIIGIFTTKIPTNNTKQSTLYTIGSAGIILRMLRIPDGSLQVITQGLRRVALKRITQDHPYFKAEIEPLEETFEKSIEFEGMLRTAITQFHEIIEHAPYLPPEMKMIIDNLERPSQQIDFMASNLNLKKEEQQQLLEQLDLTKRLKQLLSHLDHELEILKIGTKISEEIHQNMNKAQREMILRQQMEAIKKELGETDEQTVVINEMKQKIEQAKLPEEVKKETERELERMSQIPTMSPEYNVARTYLDWILSLPWSVSTEDSLDIHLAQQVLDEDHHDLEKIKERIVDYLAVRQLKKDMKGPILCFVGPPGTGKTSIGKSIARALGRKFVRMSLGGMRDEAEIRGHRRTYIGALPGRIIQSLRRAESNNPVMMLDEIDKVGMDYRGDPASALLEVLDPEQNNTFVDHYLDLPFDLSKVLFIATANVVDTIPPPLLDRMEMIQFSGYTEPQKIQIAKQFLLPKQIEENGLTKDDVVFDDSALSKIIRNYTREAGVRNLERSIASVCRKAARQVASGAKKPIQIDEKEAREILGPETFLIDVAEEKDEIGVVCGMAWTPTGGDILFVEASVVPGKGNLRITGRLGEVMRESAEAALTYVRSRAKDLGLPEDFYQNWDVHIHVPEGAVPKDGPSAGVTITTALASAYTKKPVRKDISMTGEITLRGKVLPIGGVRDKVLAAHRAGIKTIILPKENERELEDVPDHVKQNLHFKFVENLDQVLDIALRNGVHPASQSAANKSVEKSEI